MAISNDIKKQAQNIIDKFNKTNIKVEDCFYQARFRGDFLYLDRSEYGVITKIARLKFKGSINNWDFAPFKYSNECYDDEEFFFPGSQHTQKGTLEGAMKGGLELYPIQEEMDINPKEAFEFLNMMLAEMEEGNEKSNSRKKIVHKKKLDKELSKSNEPSFKVEGKDITGKKTSKKKE